MALSFEKINELEELMEAFDLLDECGIDADGVDDLPEAQRRLRQFLQKGSVGDDQQIIGSALKEIAIDNQQTKESILGLLEKVKTFLSEMPDRCKVALSEMWKNPETHIESSISELQAISPAILVAGETGSGKSSFLNLLLGELANELLPVASLSSTSVITELRYGKEKKMIAHPRNPREPKVERTLEHDAIRILSEYIHQKGNRAKSHPYILVEVFWPCEWLQGGIGIVDSPGVGEDDELTEMVKGYIPRASGFIYVINTPNAGGIDPDRLQDLVLSHRVLSKSAEESSFNPSTALFVCNKWDQVPLAERESVKKVISSKLKDMWPGFSEEQLFYLSTKQTIEELKQNHMSDNYKCLLNGIQKLIPVGFKTKMLPHYKLAKQVMERSLLEIKSFIRSKEIQDKKALLKESQEKLNSLKSRTKQIVHILEVQMSNEIRKVTRDLERYLGSTKGQDRLCKWDVKDCPQAQDYNRLQDLKEAYVNKRIRSEISNWDNENRRYEKLQSNLIKAGSIHFINIEKDLKDIEGKIVYGKSSSEAVSSPTKNLGEIDDGTGFTTAEMVLIGTTAPVWVPLGVVVSIVALPTLGIKKFMDMRKQKRLSRQYSSDPSPEMAELTKSAVDNIIKSGELDRIVEEHFASIFDNFKKLFNHIPGIIKADEQLIRNMVQTIEIETELRRKCTRLHQDGNALQGELDYMYITRLGMYRTDIDQYINKVCQGEGSFAKVFRASKKGKGLVALKELKKAICAESASDFLIEEKNLRTLQCENVIAFHGTVIRTADGQWFPILEMEYCDRTLDKIIYDSSYPAPGKQSSTAKNPTAHASSYAIGISKGLAHIHSKDFLHRDLKPENILVSAEGHPKIADLGLAKPVCDIKGTLLGTPLYMAPEVWKEEKYTEKADMFAFGMVMWELWFGCCVAVKFKIGNLKDFKQRPYPDGHSPDGGWRSLMELCWEETPDNRPSAYDCHQQLSQLYGGDNTAL